MRKLRFQDFEITRLTDLKVNSWRLVALFPFGSLSGSGAAKCVSIWGSIASGNFAAFSCHFVQESQILLSLLHIKEIYFKMLGGRLLYCWFSEDFHWLLCMADLNLSSSLLLLLSRFSRVRLCATPKTAAHQAPPSLGFSRQEHWSGLPFPSPMHESEKWKWSRSVVSDS